MGSCCRQAAGQPAELANRAVRQKTCCDKNHARHRRRGTCTNSVNACSHEIPHQFSVTSCRCASGVGKKAAAVPGEGRAHTHIWYHALLSSSQATRLGAQSPPARPAPPALHRSGGELAQCGGRCAAGAGAGAGAGAVAVVLALRHGAINVSDGGCGSGDNAWVFAALAGGTDS
jgi:hypothetical protein